MTTEKKNPDIEALVADAGLVTLTSGTQVRVERLRVRQMMRLLRIVTRGAGPLLTEMEFSRQDMEDFAGQLLGVVMISIPEAEEETVDFIKSMVLPVDLIDDPRSAPEREINAEKQARLNAELDNPEIEDLFVILEHVIRVEAPHFVSLGKRLATLLKVEQQTQVAKKRSASSRSKSSAATLSAS